FVSLINPRFQIEPMHHVELRPKIASGVAPTNILAAGSTDRKIHRRINPLNRDDASIERLYAHDDSTCARQQY
ncbi:MAG TPA: hypothetical protein VG722_03195, partial [Tepidisphaeraceae bacterium]|nr:hypothetical protein [Tepidisphaeraceae bacterium]